MSSPCHIELTLSEKEEPVKKEVIDVLFFTISLVSFGFLYPHILIKLSYLQPDTQLASRKSRGNQALRSGASS